MNVREELPDADKVVELRHGLLRVLASTAVEITVEDASDDQLLALVSLRRTGSRRRGRGSKHMQEA